MCMAIVTSLKRLAGLTVVESDWLTGCGDRGLVYDGFREAFAVEWA